MKKIKKILSVLIACCMAAGMVASAIGSEIDYSSMSDAQVAEKAFITEADVAEIRATKGDQFNAAVAEYISCLVQYDKNRTIGVSMTLAEWQGLKATFAPGVIVVTKDQSKLGYRHGHAAICWGTDSVIEHSGEGLSKKTYAEYAFREYGSAATFKPNTTVGNMSQAAAYALTNLVGWNYSVIADRTSTTGMNCATLVWKAYNNTNLHVDVCAPGGTVLPKHLDVGGYNTMMYQTSDYMRLQWSIG